MVKTAVFKLHNPSNKKRAILQRAFKNYHLLCDGLICAVKENQDGFFSSGKIRGKDTRKGEPTYHDRGGKQYFPASHKGLIRSFKLPSSLKNAAFVDAARGLISYKQLLGSRPNTSFPALQILKTDDRKAACRPPRKYGPRTPA